MGGQDKQFSDVSASLEKMSQVTVIESELDRTKSFEKQSVTFEMEGRHSTPDIDNQDGLTAQQNYKDSRRWGTGCKKKFHGHHN